MHTRLLIFSTLFVFSCTSGNDTDDTTSETGPCTDEPTEVWVSAEDVDPELRLMADDRLLMAAGVRALRGCEDLEGPLAAMNWWTVRDPEANDAYTATVGPLVMNLGAKIVYSSSSGYTTLRVPEGTVPDGTPWLQAKLDLPLYPSAESFAGMIAGEAWLRVGGYKLNETTDIDYDFVFQRCFYGCEEIQANPGFITWPAGNMMVHLFNASQTEVRDAIEPLRTAIESVGLGNLHFVGYSWAQSVMRIQDIGVPEGGNGFWNDGTILINLGRSSAAETVLALDAYQAWLSTAQNNVVVVFE